MKIIISPSKTYSMDTKVDINGTTPLFVEKMKQIRQHLQHLSDDEIKTIMKIKDKLLHDTLHDVRHYDNLKSNTAINYYTGMVFKGLETAQYKEKELDYLNEQLIILSAMYGALRPSDLVKPYRLDLKMALTDFNLVRYWSETLTAHLDDELIINLASSEFSQLIKRPMITIEFLENREGRYINIATYSKKARGYMLDYLIKNQIRNLKDIITFNIEQYQFNEELSTDSKIVFTR